jgi:hypothetical protein
MGKMSDWKTTRNKPLQVIDNIVPVPKDILNLHMDLFLTVAFFYVNKIVFLVTSPLKWIALTWKGGVVQGLATKNPQAIY